MNHMFHVARGLLPEARGRHWRQTFHVHFESLHLNTSIHFSWSNMKTTAEMANKAFAIAELLENILLQLPPRDLLLAQRVNKKWRAEIEGSTKIQQKLFYKTRPLPSAAGEEDELDCNHFLRTIIEMTSSGRWLEVEKRCKHCAKPFCLFSRPDRSLDREKAGSCRHEYHDHLHIDRRILFFSGVKPIPAGSWCDMLISVPSHAIYVRDFHTYGLWDECFVSTIGELVDFMVARKVEARRRVKSLLERSPQVHHS